MDALRDLFVCERMMRCRDKRRSQVLANSCFDTQCFVRLTKDQLIVQMSLVQFADIQLTAQRNESRDRHLSGQRLQNLVLPACAWASNKSGIR